MTGVAGVWGPGNTGVSSKVELLLSEMEARGSALRSTTIEDNGRSMAIGSCSHPGEESANNLLERTSLVIDGRTPSSLRLEEVGGQPSETALSEVIGEPGPLAFIAISSGRLLAARDMMGQKPLYYGKTSNGVFAVASLKTALTKIEITSPKPFPPGRLLSVSEPGISELVDKSLTRPKEMKVPENEASSRLGELLIESLAENVPEECALAFSGGLDSTLVAQAAKENDLRPELITVSMKGQPELDHAKNVSKSLNMDITLRELSEKEILESLTDVVKLVESTDPVLVGVSIPLFFVCEVAQEMGMSTLLAGQLSDELFAGYGRFDKFASTAHLRAAGTEVWNSVLAASTNDFEPGDKLAVSHQIDLHCPFAFLPLVQYALKVPTSLKLRVVGGKVVRKYILRRLAADWNLPEEVANKPKKAVQYSSGVQKILLKEAKKRKMTLGTFLESYA